jgi:hydrogenase maturation protease
MRALVIGCGNLLRGDDAAGPVLIRRLWDRGLPEGVRCADAGTGGMDVAFQMRGVPELILVDACRSGREPGEVFEVPGRELERLPPLSGINLHAFRWDHALAFARWLLGDDYPQRVTVCLIEGACFEVGEPLSPAVDRAVELLADRLLERLAVLSKLHQAEVLLAGDAPDAEAAVDIVREGVGLAARGRMPLLEAELWMQLGIALQSIEAADRTTMLETVRAYQRALTAGITEEDHPLWYAQVQNNLGLAYLAMPDGGAGAALRIGIAVQSFRHAARASGRGRDREGWAAAMANLASALQHAPSSHPEQNLVEAVEIYDQVLSVRTVDRDPAGRGVVLLNQANALAHLGIFAPAIDKLAEAEDLLELHGRTEEAAAVRSLRDEIESRHLIRS